MTYQDILQSMTHSCPVLYLIALCIFPIIQYIHLCKHWMSKATTK